MADPRKMTPKAKIAFDTYVAMGPSRNLVKLCGVTGTNKNTLNRWSSIYEWTRLAGEHDHKELREALGNREIVRERGTQDLIDAIPAAVKTLMDIMSDDRKLPVLDRQGVQMSDADGNLLYKPLVKASTRANCAEKILGIAGLVPVKRTIVEDRTAESLDEAASILSGMTPAQLEAFMKILGDGD